MNELRQRQREKVKKVKGYKPRGKGQVQNESPEGVQSSFDLQIVTLIQVLGGQKCQTEAQRKSGPQRRPWSAMPFPIRENEIGLLPSENHLFVSSSSLCLTNKIDLLSKWQT